MSSKRHDNADEKLDACEIDGEPFGEIMAALDELPADESLLLINSFEPEPLYDILRQRGFEYETANPASGEWHIEITKT